MGNSPQRPFYIYVSNFSRKAIRLPKHMLIAETVESPTEIHATYTEPRRGSQWRKPKEDNQVHQFFWENATSVVSIADVIAAVHNMPTKNQKPQITRHHVVEDGDSKRLSEDWPVEVQIPKKDV